MPNFIERIKKAWNAFSLNDEPPIYHDLGMVSTYRPDRTRLSQGNERSIVSSVYNKIAIDCSAVKIEHVRIDEAGRYLETIDSCLNQCLKVEANKDQTGRAFIQDAVLSMLDEGCVALVPIDTSVDVVNNSSFDILSIRTGKILEWFPDNVRVRVYNDRRGEKQDLILPKRSVAIIENPFYAVMNEKNSTMQRLIRKLNLLDVIDEQSGSGKLDLIVQLPYVLKGENRKKQAEARRAEIERQLAESKYGIAYTDGTEHITQLNRSVENNLMTQITYLTDLMFSQLGITTDILNGSADESVMNNYTRSIVEPIMSALTSEMYRKFLTKTARAQRQSIMFFNEPFKLIPVGKIADIADKFTRNEIMTSNEVRQLVGFKPSTNPEADELRNKNLNKSSEEEKQEANPKANLTAQEKNEENEV